MNQINVIHPYLDGSVMVFDDPSRGLVKEALVGGTDSILKDYAKKSGLENTNKFTLIFSDIPFKGFFYCAYHLGKDESGFGDNYRVGNSIGWLCPALLKYFSEPPKTIYFTIKEFRNDHD